MPLSAIDNLAPDRFVFWRPAAGSTVAVGAESQPVELPDFPLPVHCEALGDGVPSDAAIGQGVYDYLRQFPDCAGNVEYARLLREAYPHFLADLAAHAVMLDAKQVEPAYVVRKLTCLKILRLIEPQNRGLLRQLSSGYFKLALEFAEFARARQHLREAMRFGQDLLVLDPDDPQALSLLAEVDYWFGDLPGASAKWQRLAAQVDDAGLQARIKARVAACAGSEPPEHPLIEELEAIAEAMQLQAAGDAERATSLLEQIEEQWQLPKLFPSADFYCLLGQCRLAAGDQSGAVVALHKALALEPDHASTLKTLDSM